MEVQQGLYDNILQLLDEGTVKLYPEEEQGSIVEKYLSESAFLGFGNSRRIQNDKSEDSAENYSTLSKPLQSQTKKYMHSTKNSIFHNFQKHLITIIKKLVNIHELTFHGYPNHHLAFDLWKTFLMSRSSSKKVFQITFGVYNTNRQQEELLKLGEMFPQFKLLLTRHSIEEIEYAQELVRREVASQARRLSKTDVVAKCRVHKSEQFYEYFKAFIHDLFQGQIANRISKIQKQKLIVNLYSGSKID